MNQGRNFLWCQDTDIRKNQIKTIFFLALFYNGEIEFFFFFTEHIEFKISYQKITFFVDFKNRLCDFVRLSFFFCSFFFTTNFTIYRRISNIFFLLFVTIEAMITFKRIKRKRKRCTTSVATVFWGCLKDK